MIIGLVGTHGSGKGTAAKILTEKGFVSLRCSDVIREECDRRGIEQTRENLFIVSKDLVDRFGHDIVAVRLMEKIEEGKDYCIDGIRRIKETERFRERKDFFLISVDADIKIRYERIQDRKDTTDDISFEKFKELEENEMNNKGNNMQLRECMNAADYKINNNDSQDELKKQVVNILNILGEKNGSFERS